MHPNKKLERIVKGFSNHRRIEIMNLLDSYPELSLDEISKRLRCNFKTISEHIRRLSISGLVYKRYEGRKVCHKLSSRGINILTFLRKLE